MNASANPADQGVPLGAASPDEPAHTLPAEPSHSTQASDSTGREANGSARQAPKPPGSEEPAFALEPDLPTDGRDEVGEAMIRDLPQRPELSEPPSQPDPSHQKPWKIAMATNPNVPPPEPVEPLSTPPEPGEVQTTPMPMVAQAGTAHGWCPPAGSWGQTIGAMQMSKTSSPPIAKPEKIPSVQADVLGDDTALQSHVSPHRHEQERTASADASEPKTAQDENQPGFIGERNLPHPWCGWMQ